MNPNPISELLRKLDELKSKQERFQEEIRALQNEIRNLQEKASTPEIAPSPVPVKPKSPAHEEETEPDVRRNLEKFIGENLLNKIGIIILVIGVGIGAKYAIDHNLISPGTRIILGYILGLGLFGIAFRLRKEYENFSAVLLSGSMAIMYFLTFAAYSFYSLIPVGFTFALMVLFTVFTVAAAISYNRQVIAHIGLVGAYAVPFLLSDGSGKVVILFSYMAIINAGILAISFRKYWKPLCYSSFLITWLIVVSWFVTGYVTADHFAIVWTFISIYFVTFYLIFLAYKLRKDEKFSWDDIVLLLANSAVFYGLGYSVLHQHLEGEEFEGLFTFGNAFLHLVTALFVYRKKQADRNLFYLLFGLSLAFFTIAIPVQLDGNWIPVFWSIEAALLFCIGRTRNAVIYKSLSLPVMVLAFFSLVFGWREAYHNFGYDVNSVHMMFLLNTNFLTSVLVITSFSCINFVHGSRQFISSIHGQETLLRWMNFILPGMLLIISYFAFYTEITTFWNQRYLEAMVTVDKGLTAMQEIRNEDIPNLKTIWILNYSLLFFSLLSFANILKFKNRILGLINTGFNAIVTGIFLTLGLFALGMLRESYLSQSLSEFFYRGAFNIGIRYVSFLFLALLLLAMYRYVKQEFMDENFQKEFDIFLHIVILTVAGNELINWMDIFESGQSYKLGLSILFGGYSLLLIALGIWKHKLHLRIMAIVVFAVTLVKLFFYDLSSLNTISKTIVFVVLGILLLIISFLYNKFKHVIFDDRINQGISGKEEGDQ